VVHSSAFKDDDETEAVSAATSTNNFAAREEIYYNSAGDKTTGKPNKRINVTAHGTFWWLT